MLNQLFDVDAQLIDTGAVADLIISQSLLGSTVKVEDEEKEAKDNDPFAFLSVLNLYTHRRAGAVQKLAGYLGKVVGKTSRPDGTEIASLLKKTMEEKGDIQIGVLLSERLVNMPPDVSPPMYNMLLEEVEWAIEEHEPFKFTHYLLVSKTYTEIESDIISDADAFEDQRKNKRQKTSKSTGQHSSTGNIQFFHPEDEVFARYAVVTSQYRYEREGEASSDAKRAFYEAGIKPQGSIYLIEADKLKHVIKDVQSFIGTSATIDETE